MGKKRDANFFETAKPRNQANWEFLDENLRLSFEVESY